MNQVKRPTVRPSTTAVTQAALGTRSAVVGRAGDAAAPTSVTGPSARADAFQTGLGAPAAPPSAASSAEGAAAGFAGELDAAGLESLGSLHAAVHLVKQMHHWGAENGASSSDAAQRAAQLLAQFSRPETARAVARELDRMPIYNVYPLQVQMALMDLAPGLMAGWEHGEVVENRKALDEGGRVLAGHASMVHVPPTFTVTAMALLSDGQPGYVFEPQRRGVFRLEVDTPGRHTFALRAVRGEQTVVDRFTVDVREPGRVARRAAP
jgi:hypothetical protein